MQKGFEHFYNCLSYSMYVFLFKLCFQYTLMHSGASSIFRMPRQGPIPDHLKVYILTVLPEYTDLSVVLVTVLDLYGTS